MKTKRVYAGAGMMVLLLVASGLMGCSSGELASLLGGGSSTTTHLAVADYGNNRTVIFPLPATTNEAATVALGQVDLNSSACAASATGECSPNNAAMDPSGNLWVADYGNCRVLEYKPPFTTNMAATLAIGQVDLNSSACGLSASSIQAPANLVFDASGNMWLLDWSNNRILEFKPPFSNGMAASTVIGQANMTSNASATTATGLKGPWQGIAIDPHGNLWVGDRGNCRVLEYVPPFTTGMAASVVIGQANMTSSACGVSTTLTNGISGITFDANGNLWTLDAHVPRVEMFPAPQSTNEAATVVIGQPDFTSTGSGTTASTFSHPYDVAFDSSGKLYVPESGNNRVTIFAPPFSNGMSATKVLGQADFTSSSGGTSATLLSGPEGAKPVK